MSFKAFCKAFVGRYEITYYKEDHVVDKISPGTLSFKEASKTDQDKNKRDQE
jgi:hypothetical protein